MCSFQHSTSTLGDILKAFSLPKSKQKSCMNILRRPLWGLWGLLFGWLVLDISFGLVEVTSACKCIIPGLERPLQEDHELELG